MGARFRRAESRRHAREGAAEPGPEDEAIRGRAGRRAGQWRRLNRARRRRLDQLEAPTANDEYLLYQTLLGAWPQSYDDAAVPAAFGERVESYLVKVVREAKAVSSWVNPNEEYEAVLTGFARALLGAETNARFLESFLPFQRKVAWFGMLNSLSMALLKLTAPGVPDIY